MDDADEPTVDKRKKGPESEYEDKLRQSIVIEA